MHCVCNPSMNTKCSRSMENALRCVWYGMLTISVPLTLASFEPITKTVLTIEERILFKDANTCLILFGCVNSFSA